MKEVKSHIDILIVDDSALVRKVLSEELSKSPDINVLKPAADPYFAARQLKKQIPDVILLDIEMPRMDGITFLKLLMSQYPIPVIILSSLSINNANIAIKALELGAFEVIDKPIAKTTEEFIKSISHLEEVIRSASNFKPQRQVEKREIRRKRPRPLPTKPIEVTSAYSTDIIVKKGLRNHNIPKTEPIIAIGASTGGTEAIKKVIKDLPENTPAILFTQHIPSTFCKQFVDRLDEICKIRVKMAEEGDTVEKGTAYVAPSGKHLLLRRVGTKYTLYLSDGLPVNRHKPSVDVMFRTVASNAGKNALGILLTGMGADGAEGMLEMRENGALTIAQDEHSCVVFGMPREAIERGGASMVMSPNEVFDYISKNYALS